MSDTVASTTTRDSALLPPTPEAGQPAQQPAWPVVLRGIWQVLTSPWLALVLSVVLVLLAAVAFVLPQMPGQLNNEASAAERWLTDTSDALGSLGLLPRALGLFNVLHSPLLLVVVALLAFVLLVRLARLISAAYRLRRVAEVLDQTGTTNGEPLPVAAADALLRWRRAVAAPALTLTNELQRLLEARLGHVDRRTVRVAVAPAAQAVQPGPTSEPGTPAASPKEGSRRDSSQDDISLEERLLALRGLPAVYLRPLLVAGMLCAVVLIWLNIVFGWEFTPTLLVPGERTTDAVHNVRLEYRLDQPAPATIAPVLQATVGGESIALPVQSEMQSRLGGVDVKAQPGAPALVVRTVDGSPLLARPGQANPVAAIGLGFPSAGSEETLLMPTEAIGLRIVRIEQGMPGPVGDSFLVEVFQGGSEEAIMRVTIGGSEIVTIPTKQGALALALVPLPSLAIQVRQTPGTWLLWLSIALGAVGALGFWQQTGFVLAQVGAWPEDRTVITVQTDLPGEMASLRRWYAGQQEPEISPGTKELR